MSPTARLTAAFVPLSSPPLRVSFQSLRWLARRAPLIRPPSAPQCRSLHMYKTARAKTVLGMHKILPFSRYDLPDMATSGHKVNIVKFVRKGQEIVRETVAQDLTLQQVYDDYITPGKILRLADTISKEHTPANPDELERLQTAQRNRDYVILEAYSTNAHVVFNGKKITKAKGDRTEILHLQGLKEVHLLLGTPVPHYNQMMDKAYRFIEVGCPVEFSIRVRNVTEKKFSKQESKTRDLFDYAFQRFPHLRPDFILKSMPEGTRYVIEPFSDGRHCQFVLGLKTRSDRMQTTNLTKRLLNVKRAVGEAVGEGKAHQLPKAMRFRLIEEGEENYSLDTGIAKAGRPHGKRSFREKGSGDRRGEVPRWGADSTDSENEKRIAEWKEYHDRARDSSRYMYARSKDVPKPPTRDLMENLRNYNQEEKAAKRFKNKKHIPDPELVEKNRQRQKLANEKHKQWLELRKQKGEQKKREEAAEEAAEKQGA